MIKIIEVRCTLSWVGSLLKKELNLIYFEQPTMRCIIRHGGPEYLKVEKREPKRLLRSSKAPLLVVPLTKGTFQNSISRLFNELPAEIRSCSELPSYIRQANDIFNKGKSERTDSLFMTIPVFYCK
jgi:hypothetical protein